MWLGSLKRLLFLATVCVEMIKYVLANTVLFIQHMPMKNYRVGRLRWSSDLLQSRRRGIPGRYCQLGQGLCRDLQVLPTLIKIIFGKNFFMIFWKELESQSYVGKVTSYRWKLLMFINIWGSCPSYVTRHIRFFSKFQPFFTRIFCTVL